MDSPETEASLIAKQAPSELVMTFCSLERSNAEDQNKVLGMQNPVFHAPTRATINLSLPWHSTAVAIADRNFNIVTGKLSKHMRSLNPAKPGVSKVFFSGVGYYTHNLEGYVSCYTIKASSSRTNSKGLALLSGS